MTDVNAETASYSGEFKLSPSVVRSLPSARCTIPGSVSAARINVRRPTMPNWSVTIPEGMFVTRPAAEERPRFTKPQICSGVVIYRKYLL